MGIDTKGCVVTENKDVFMVSQAVNNWWSKVKKDNNITFKDFWKESPEWSQPKVELGWSKSLNIYFKYKGEERRIFVSFDCDCDLEIYDEIEGNSCIWFSWVS